MSSHSLNVLNNSYYYYTIGCILRDNHVIMWAVFKLGSIHAPLKQGMNTGCTRIEYLVEPLLSFNDTYLTSVVVLQCHIVAYYCTSTIFMCYVITFIECFEQ